MESEDKPRYFRNAPLSFFEGIPVFCTDDEYNRNYEKISQDHLNAIRPGSDNPFSENALWEGIEESTRTLIRKHVAPQTLILDVGVGMGRLLSPLTNLQRHGIDISTGYLMAARKNNITVSLARSESIPYVDSYFDCVCCTDVLEHVLDLNVCTAEMLRVLKPGGTLIVRVPYVEDIDHYIDYKTYEFVHLRSFSYGSLRLHFEKIFHLRYLEHSFTEPYLQGAPRLKVRPPVDTLAIREIIRPYKLKRGLKAFFGIRPPLHFTQLQQIAETIEKTTSLSQAELLDSLYACRELDNGLYSAIAKHLILPIEINMVFTKPAK